MSIEYELEPTPGLPEALPKGEAILWQGAPEWTRLARDAFRVTWVIVYFAALMLWALIEGNLAGAMITAIVAASALGLIALLAYASSRTTLYTITNRRIVMRFGVALTKCVNLPMRSIATVQVKLNKDGSGDIVMLPGEAHGLGYIQFWPHVRPFHFGTPQPMLRSITGVAAVAEQLSAAMAIEVPTGERSAIADPAASPETPAPAWAATA